MTEPTLDEQIAAAKATYQKLMRQREANEDLARQQDPRQPQAFVYCRVSTESQKWGLHAQLDACLNACEERKFNVGAPMEVARAEAERIKGCINSADGRQAHFVARNGIRLFVDKGHSGSKRVIDRPAAKELFALLRRDDILVVATFTRLGRSMKDVVERMDYLHKRGIRLVICSAGGLSGLDYGTPMGKFLYHILASVAEFEREMALENTIAGRAAKKASGEYHENQPPGKIGRTHVLIHKRSMSKNSGHPVHVQCVADHDGEKVAFGYLCWWFYVEGLSWNDCRVRWSMDKRWAFLRELATHQHDRGRVKLAEATLAKAVKHTPPDTQREWMELAAEHMGRTLPPDSEWAKDPITRELRVRRGPRRFCNGGE